MEIQKEYTKEGMKLTHPSGYIQIIKEDFLIHEQERIREEIQQGHEGIKSIQQDIINIRKAREK
jgi:hypothetical protein